MIRSATLGVALFAAGCGTVATADIGPSESSAPSVNPASDELVLRVEAVGGFTPPAWTYGRIPMVSIYADGRVITEGPQVTIYPAPAMPNLQVGTLSPGAVDALVDKARAAGVGRQADYGQPGVADATTTRFTLVDDGKKVTAEVYALSETRDEDPALTAAQRQARERMRTLLTTLRESPGTGGDTAYEPASVATIVSAYVAGGSETPQPARAWRGVALPGPVIGPADLHCTTTTGTALGNVLADAESANVATPWTYAGKSWTLMFRPLLPDESGCDSLGR